MDIQLLRTRAQLFSAGLFFSLVGVSVLADTFAPPASYYLPASGLSGQQLRGSLHGIIAPHTVLSYAIVAAAIPALDEDPDNSNNVILIYSGFSVPKAHANYSIWNREHVWPQSWGADDGPANSDFHHLFPCNPGVNSARLNYFFDWLPIGSPVNNAPGSKVNASQSRFEPRDEDKGRIARTMLYMDVRYYNGDGATPIMRLANRPNSGSGSFSFAYLDPILEWNRMYSPDNRERRRNHLIYDGARVGTQIYRQRNRNPFIDYPELADALHLPASTVTYGNWRWRNFSLGEINDPEISADWADPDGDGVVNLIELAINGNPHEPTETVPLEIIRGADGAVELRYSRLVHRDLSGLFYHIEQSSDPLDPESWQRMTFAAEDTTVSSLNASLQLVTHLTTDSATGPRPTHYRLVVERAYPIGQEAMAAYDPVAANNSNGSIFAYDRRYGSGWVWTWMGWLNDAHFPWVAIHHKWYYVVAEDTSSVFLMIDRGNWFWTGENHYPNVYWYGSTGWRNGLPTVFTQ